MHYLSQCTCTDFVRRRVASVNRLILSTHPYQSRRVGEFFHTRTVDDYLRSSHDIA
jgi:hypothetical protein